MKIKNFTKIPFWKHLLILFLLISQNVFSQNLTVTGVINSDEGELLPGVSVLVKGTTIGTTTDTNGKYTISIPSSDATLVFSFIGFVTEEVQVNNRSTVDFTLTQDLKSLTEVVVVGYGTQLKREVTGSVQSVSAKELADIPVSQISQKLQGKLSGVQITQTTGQPGAGLVVRIRGQASISAGNTPLYVIDGFPIVGDIGNINPDEIENITVLKDASSTSLYGSRAANGVVLITTKTGKAGKTSVGVNVYYGVQSVPEKGRPEMMNAREFAQFQKELSIENNRAVDQVYQNPEQYGEGTDWYDIIFRNASIKNYSVSLAGGTEKFSTSATAGFFSQDGVMLNSNFKRFSLRINSQFNPFDKVKIGFNLAPMHSVNNTPQSDGVWWTVPSIIQGAILTTPLAPYQNSDGTIPLTATGPGLFANPNWYNVLQVIKNETKNNRLLSNGYLEIEPLKNLALKTSINVDLGERIFSNFTPSTAGYLFNPPPLIPTSVNQNTRYNSWLSENTATYRTSFGEHNIEGLVGYSAQKYHEEFERITGSNYPDDKVQTINAASTTVSTSDIQEWSLSSFIARLNYNYKGKYILSAAVRRDGSSRFGSENRWGNFPSISAGWVMTDEGFMPDNNIITFLKLRASYGLIGNNNIGNYTHLPIVASTNYIFNNQFAIGRTTTNLGNTQLGWEQTKQFDFGADLGLLHDRITISYDFYNKKTDDLLYQIALPINSGYSNVFQNIGAIKFWGHEFSVNSKNLVGDLRWNTDFNIAFNNNKVLKLGTENTPIYGDYSITEVGQPIGQFYGYEMEGVYKDQSEFDNSPKHPTSVVGSAKMRDIDGDGNIEDGNDDRTVIGNPLPKFIYGMTNSLSYKNIDLSIVIAGSYGNDIAYMTQEFTTNLDGVFNVEKEVANRWKSPQEPGNGKYGTTKSGSTGLNRSFNTTYVYDGSYLAIKNITLGYTIPAKVKLLQSIRVYGSIQQAAVFTNYKTNNPEVSTNRGGGIVGDPLAIGIDHSTYPVPRTYTLGLNLNF